MHFAKGCYVGQEIVERIRSRGQVHRVFSGFELTAPATAGDKISADGKDIGEITSTAAIQSAKATKLIALGYLRRGNRPLDKLGLLAGVGGQLGGTIPERTEQRQPSHRLPVVPRRLC